ncbi:MAG: hypothetical protein CSA15_08575 [Candidatus Delongbacteria bacterium]|nr:MAG: hypothetical protein CSA15_08575 [Candidatus Delongbacteria bacterium]
MKTLTGILTILITFTIYSCQTTKNKTTNDKNRMKFIVSKIQNEIDGQTVFLKDDKGRNYTTIISIPNGNYIDLKVGNRISLIAKEIIGSAPAQIISEDIKVLNKIEYEKTEEKVFWVNSRKTKGNGMWGQPMECLQIQKDKRLNKNGEWETLCDEIEYFHYLEGMYYQVKVLKKWLKNHENLMDRTPYDLELIIVLSKEKDPTYINPIKTKITTNKNTYKVGESIELSMEIKNTGKKSYTFLPWGTPIENTFTDDCLKITYNNKTINYSGIIVKRVPPTEKDYVTLKTGETAKGKVNLFEGYKLTEKGLYTIQFKETYKGIPNSNNIKIEIK